LKKLTGLALEMMKNNKNVYERHYEISSKIAKDAWRKLCFSKLDIMIFTNTMRLREDLMRRKKWGPELVEIQKKLCS